MDVPSDAAQREAVAARAAEWVAATDEAVAGGWGAGGVLRMRPVAGTSELDWGGAVAAVVSGVEFGRTAGRIGGAGWEAEMGALSREAVARLHSRLRAAQAAADAPEPPMRMAEAADATGEGARAAVAADRAMAVLGCLQRRQLVEVEEWQREIDAIELEKERTAYHEALAKPPPPLRPGQTEDATSALRRLVDLDSARLRVEVAERELASRSARLAAERAECAARERGLRRSLLAVAEQGAG